MSARTNAPTTRAFAHAIDSSSSTNAHRAPRVQSRSASRQCAHTTDASARDDASSVVRSRNDKRETISIMTSRGRAANARAWASALGAATSASRARARGRARRGGLRDMFPRPRSRASLEGGRRRERNRAKCARRSRDGRAYERSDGECGRGMRRCLDWVPRSSAARRVQRKEQRGDGASCAFARVRDDALVRVRKGLRDVACKGKDEERVREKDRGIAGRRDGGTAITVVPARRASSRRHGRGARLARGRCSHLSLAMSSSTMIATRDRRRRITSTALASRRRL